MTWSAATWSATTSVPQCTKASGTSRGRSATRALSRWRVDPNPFYHRVTEDSESGRVELIGWAVDSRASRAQTLQRVLEGGEGRRVPEHEANAFDFRVIA